MIDNEEYLTRCVVDANARNFYIYSNEGDEKVLSCDTTEEFMNVLSFVRSVLDDDILVYSSPLVSGTTFS